MGDSYREARSLAISYIGISHKSSGKVRDYLCRKGFSNEISDQVVISLISDGYIDDLRVAGSLIRSRKGRKTESKRALQQRMYHAGISRESIEAACVSIPDDSISIQELIEDKLIPDLQKQVLADAFDAELWMNKSVRFLLSRGFSSTLCMTALRRRIRDVE